VLLGEYELKLKGGARRPSRPAAPAQDEGPGGAPRPTRAVPSIRAGARPAAGGAEGAPRRPERPAAGGAGGGALVLRGAGQSWPVRGKMTVGRLAPATIVVDDDSVSRKHAELEKTPRGVVLRDLGSANGTLVNGESVGPEGVTLQPGDSIQFGVVEMTLESGEAGASSDLPVRSSRGGAVPTRRGGGGGRSAPAAAAGGGGGGAKRKKLFAVVGGLVLLVAGGGIVAKVALTEPVEVDSGYTDPSAGGTAAAPADPKEAIQEFLSQCRSFSSEEMGNEPNWDKALVACQAALDLDPIHTEANTLVKRVKLEKEAFDLFQQGKKALERLKEEEALDLFRKIPKESMYFRRAKPKVRETVDQIVKRAKEDCQRYLRDSQWSAAVPRCDRYVGFWCQNVPREELEPPLGFSLQLEGRLKRNAWRPKDALLIKFLIAREKLDKNVAPWKCPVSDIFADDERPVDPRIAVEAAFKARYTNKYMFAAMMDYWGGRGNEALITLQRLRSLAEQAQFHLQADELIRDIGTAHNLYKTGETYLAEGDVEKAAEPFREALEVDKRLMGDLAETKPSFYRRSLLQDVADKAYERGRFWAERQAHRRGCRLWKLGFSFYAGNTQLNKAVGFCSSKGLEVFNSASQCEDLQAVLDYAVKGDGLQEKVDKQKAEWNCAT
jgi:tetratricopeptide (TPR) repeat protein